MALKFYNPISDKMSVILLAEQKLSDEQRNELNNLMLELFKVTTLRERKLVIDRYNLLFDTVNAMRQVKELIKLKPKIS